MSPLSFPEKLKILWEVTTGSYWMIFVALLLGILGIIQAIRKNEDWYKFINLASGIFILLIVASIGIKQIVSKKLEKSEEEE